MLFFILPLIGIIEHLFPGSMKSVFDLLEQLDQSGSLDFINNGILSALDKIINSESFRTLIVPSFDALISKLIEIGVFLGIYSY